MSGVDGVAASAVELNVVEDVDLVGEAAVAAGGAADGTGAGAGAGAGAGEASDAGPAAADGAPAYTASVLTTCGYRVDDVSFSGTELVVGCSSLEGKLWDGRVLICKTTGGSAVAAIATESGVTSVDWASEDNVVCACDSGDILSLRRSVDDVVLKSAAVFAEHQCTASSVSVHAATGRLASGSWDATVKVWNIGASNRSLTTFVGHCGRVSQVKWNAAGSCVASGAEDCTVKLWDPRADSGIMSIAAGSPVLSLAWNPVCDTQFVVGMEDGHVAVFDSRHRKAPCQTVVRGASRVPC